MLVVSFSGDRKMNMWTILQTFGYKFLEDIQFILVSFITLFVFTEMCYTFITDRVKIRPSNYTFIMSHTAN